MEIPDNVIMNLYCASYAEIDHYIIAQNMIIALEIFAELEGGNPEIIKILQVDMPVRIQKEFK